MIKYEDVYKIGKIGRPHGIKGEMLLMFTDDVFDTTDAQYLILEVDGILVPFFIEEYRFRSDETALIKFLDIESKEQAQNLTNCAVYFPRQAAEDNYHYSWSQLVGYKATVASDFAAGPLGTIADIDMTTENYLFVIDRNGEEVLIPAVDEFIADIDHQSKTIIMNLPEGLI